ncbi:helix-turn-helix domain-containing protein [Morganella morganii]|uniref:helix-turn-helix domain-containing protein n=1 Tax=Morganella morganii TaxID=582 RepID=UPI003EB8F0FA
MKLKDSELNASVGNKIKKIRTTLDMTEEQLALKVGISVKNISQYESGVTSIPVDAFFLISRALNVSVIELLSDYFRNSDNEHTLMH